jgi:ArsR family transcriptional regulator
MALPALDELNLLHSNICQALGDPKRLQILYVLHDQTRHVTALAEALDVPQPTVSRHLRVLRECGLVHSKRNGPAVYYSVADERIIQVLDTMRTMLRDLLGRQSDILAN